MTEFGRVLAFPLQHMCVSQGRFPNAPSYFGRSGGRSSSRRVDHDTDLLYFDHGCQFIRASEPAFAAEATKWEQKGKLPSHLVIVDVQYSTNRS